MSEVILSYRVALKVEVIPALGLEEDHKSLLEVDGPLRLILGQGDLRDTTKFVDVEEGGLAEVLSGLSGNSHKGGKLQVAPVALLKGSGESTSSRRSSPGTVTVIAGRQLLVHTGVLNVADLDGKLVLTLDLKVNLAPHTQTRVMSVQLRKSGKHASIVLEHILLTRLPTQGREATAGGGKA